MKKWFWKKIEKKLKKNQKLKRWYHLDHFALFSEKMLGYPPCGL